MMGNPWLGIPLADYEGHMAMPSIGQAQLLADTFASLLAELAPSSVAVIGCAGGNGFDRIDPTHVQRVIGVDVNPDYIDQARLRYGKSIPGLELYPSDIESQPLTFEPVDLIYAALLFEYVDVAAVMRKLHARCNPGGVLAVVIQLPDAKVAAISSSPYSSLKRLQPLMRLVAPQELQRAATEAGFKLLREATLTSPAGKQFLLRLLSH